MMYKLLGWDFPSSMTMFTGDTILGHPYSEELAGSDGVGFHLWLPANISKAKRKEIEHHLCSTRDVVSISWEPLTPEVREWLTATRPPAGFIQAKLPALLEHHKEKRGFAKVWWGKGQRLTIDSFSLSALAAIYEALNEANQEKLKELVEKGPGACAKAIEICFSLLNKDQKERAA